MYFFLNLPLQDFAHLEFCASLFLGRNLKESFEVARLIQFVNIYIVIVWNYWQLKIHSRSTAIWGCYVKHQQCVHLVVCVAELSVAELNMLWYHPLFFLDSDKCNSNLEIYEACRYCGWCGMPAVDWLLLERTQWPPSAIATRVTHFNEVILLRGMRMSHDLKTWYPRLHSFVTIKAWWKFYMPLL